MTDLHVHTHRSADSSEMMSAYIDKAIDFGVGTICFTDHVDVNPHDYGFKYFEPSEYWKDYEAALMQSGSITLLSGVEFGEPNVYPSEYEELVKQPFDYIIGSVHYPEKYPAQFFSELVSSGISAEDCYETYWESVLACVKFGRFDCLGHIDIPKRYYGSLIYDEKKLREIFHVALENGVIIEINTSSLRKSVGETMPGSALLDLYRSEGGRYATIGSDAHRAQDLGTGIPEAKALLDRSGLKEVKFINRKMVECG